MPLSPDDRFSALLGRREESGWNPEDADEELADQAPRARPVPPRLVLVIVVVLVVLGVAGFLGYHRLRAQAAASPVEPAPDAQPVTQVAGKDPSGDGRVMVHVVGQVRRPGVVTLPADSRVADALSAAGGLTKRADASAVNQARVLVDGEQIVVPKKGQSAGGGVGEAGSAPATAAGAPAGGKVNINTADVVALDALPGVGPVTAQAIVSYREEHGSFSSVDALTEVSGIGPATLEKLRPLVTV